jgi:hypothetical protein
MNNPSILDSIVDELQSLGRVTVTWKGDNDDFETGAAAWRPNRITLRPCAQSCRVPEQRLED